MHPQRKNKKKGNKFESQVKNTINSGSLWFAKGDLQSAQHCIECKYTDKKGFRITTNILEKLWNEALTSNHEPLLVIGIARNDREIFTLYCHLVIEKK